MKRFPYNDIVLCLMLIALLVVATYYAAGWAFGDGGVLEDERVTDNLLRPVPQ